MTTKEIAVKHQENQNDLFNWPLQMGWLDEIIPNRWLSNISMWKPIKLEESFKDGKLVIRAEMPGIDPDKDIDVSLHDGVLTISGEREERITEEHRSEFNYGSFSRSISLPRGYDEKSIHASYKHGILEVTMNVPKNSTSGRKIQVNKAL